MRAVEPVVSPRSSGRERPATVACAVAYHRPDRFEVGGRRQAALAYPIVVEWRTRLFLVDAVRTLGGRGWPGFLAARWVSLTVAVGAWREVLR